jgi:hypothetical protein
MRWQSESGDTAFVRLGRKLIPNSIRLYESGVALRFPPQSKLAFD